MARIKVGFDIGGSSMKAAAAQGGGLRVETVRLPEKLIDENGITMPNAFSQFLKQTMKELRMPRGPAALVLPSNQVICRLVNMPEMNQEQLMMNLPYEFADFIQGAPDQYFCDYALCGKGSGDEEGTMPMMAAVASKRQLEQYIKMFAKAGVRLKKLVPQEMALIELCRAQPAGEGPREFCFVDLGHQQTRITVVLGDRVQATRRLNFGGRDMDLAIAEELGVDAFLAGTYKMGGQQSALAVPAVADVCERLAVEMLKRQKEGRPITFYHYMLDLEGGPCLHKRMSGCGSGTEYLAVTPWGELFPCHQFVNDPDYSMGSVWDGVTNPALGEKFHRCSVAANPDCRDCWARLYCAGGCAANAYHASGDINGTYEYGCALFKKRVECAIMMKAAQAQAE